MPAEQKCPQCGSVMFADAPKGLCPRCLMGAALAPAIPAPVLPTVPVETAGDEGASERIGRYKILQKLGEGGCGVVYMAEQMEPVRRRVALKVIKLGMDTKQVIARFEAERQALALMDHPNIAKVLDAGATATGRPYFVMELVKGIRLTDYCDQHHLSTADRLGLFTQVCQAIQHAHQKGIIHRDIKPSNILVTLHDGVPVPKVIDFGIAKATEQPLTEKTVFTAFGQFMGTPAYMSPEQAELSGLDIDTRSDIYALGVLLYELLTGKTPFDAKELLQAGLDEMRRRIREEEPMRPSTRLSTMADADLTNVAQQRQSEPAKLTRFVRGDLDWIVMKCLEKDRTRRYDTANGLALDLRRHLNNEPVVACPPSAAYKFRKFARRNRVLVLAGAAVAAALLVGAIAFAWQAQLARNQRDAAIAARESEATQRRVAEAQRAQAELITGFMSETLQGAGPSVARGRDITMLREMMDAAAARIEKGDLKSAPEAELRLRATIGATYRKMGVYDAAQRMLEPAVALARSTYSGDNHWTASVLNSLAVLFKERGDLAAAEPLYRESLEMTQRLFPGDHPDVAAGLYNLANLHKDRGDLTTAEPLCRESLEMRKRLFQGDHPDVAQGLSSLSILLKARGDLAEVESLDRESLEMRKRLFKGDHPDVAQGLSDLAVLLKDRGDLAGAEPLYRESLEMRKRLFPGDHSEVALGLNNLAVMLQARGDLLAAEPLLRESLEMKQRLFPNDHPDVAAGLVNLGALLRARGDLVGAEPLFIQALEMQRRLSPADHPLVLVLKNAVAALFWSQGKLDKSVPMFEEVLMVQEAKLGRPHPDTLMTVANLGVNYKDAGRFAEAIPLLEEAYQHSKQYPHLGFAGPELLDAYIKAVRQDKPESIARVVTLIRELLVIARNKLPKESPDLAGYLATLCVPLLELKKWEEAEPLLRETLTIREAKAPDDWRTFNTKAMLGGALLGQKKFAEAEPLLLEGYRGMKQHEAAIPAQGKIRIPEALERLVQLYEMQGNETEAAAWRTKLEAVRAAQNQPATPAKP